MSVLNIIGKTVTVLVLTPLFIVFCRLFYEDQLKFYFYRDQLFFIENEQIYVRTQRDVDREFTRMSFGKTKEDIENESDYVLIDRYNYEEVLSSFIKQRDSDTLFITLFCEERAIKEIKSTHFQLVYLPSDVIIYAEKDKKHWQTLPSYCQRFIDNPDNYSAYRIVWKDNKMYWQERFFNEKGSEHTIFPTYLKPL